MSTLPMSEEAKQRLIEDSRGRVDRMRQAQDAFEQGPQSQHFDRRANEIKKRREAGPLQYDTEQFAGRMPGAIPQRQVERPQHIGRRPEEPMELFEMRHLGGPGVDVEGVFGAEAEPEESAIAKTFNFLFDDTRIGAGMIGAGAALLGGVNPRNLGAVATRAAQVAQARKLRDANDAAAIAKLQGKSDAARYKQLDAEHRAQIRDWEKDNQYAKERRAALQKQNDAVYERNSNVRTAQKDILGHDIAMYGHDFDNQRRARGFEKGLLDEEQKLIDESRGGMERIAERAEDTRDELEDRFAPPKAGAAIKSYAAYARPSTPADLDFIRQHVSKYADQYAGEEYGPARSIISAIMKNVNPMVAAGKNLDEILKGIDSKMGQAVSSGRDGQGMNFLVADLQARKELGEDASSTEVYARAQELMSGGGYPSPEDLQSEIGASTEPEAPVSIEELNKEAEAVTATMTPKERAKYRTYRATRQATGKTLQMVITEIETQTGITDQEAVEALAKAALAEAEAEAQ